jgi:hypothetical protein
VSPVLSIAPTSVRRMVVLAACILCACGCRQNSEPAPTNREAKAGASVAQSIRDRYDLSHDEERGGHTLRKHVGRTDLQLAERLRVERHISAASTWIDLETAEETVTEALANNSDRVEKWIRRGYPRPNLALHYDAGRVIGRTLTRREARAVDSTSAVVVLRADGPETYYVLTTYPEARE